MKGDRQGSARVYMFCSLACWGVVGPLTKHKGLGFSLQEKTE